MEGKNSPSNDRQNVSFKFSKTSSKTLSGNRLDEESKDYVTSVDKSEIKGVFAKPKQKELVIPLIKKNTYKLDASQSGLSKEEIEIKNQAIKELLKETSEKNAQWENREFNNYTVTIPLLMQNKAPGRFDNDGKLDVSYRPEEPQLEDYETVPVEQYGLAMLRGMGAKEEDIKKSKNSEPFQVEHRIMGLGLGADTSKWKKAQKKAEEEKLELVNGAYVNIIQGPHKGSYAQVLGLDGENARVVVKLSNEDKTITLPEFFVGVVSKKEYDKESKVINRSAYESYKQRDEEKEERRSHSSRREEDRGTSRNSKDSKRSGDSYERDDRKSDKKLKRKHHSRENSEEPTYESKASKPWVRPQLRVRFIDDKYKKGRYFNKKVIVVDVPSSKYCSCKTDDDKYLDDISPSMLETVIPRDESAFVMIVKGKHCGEICTILKKDKSKCVAVVQFLSDRNQAIKIEYDSICEYVGDIAQFD